MAQLQYPESWGEEDDGAAGGGGSSLHAYLSSEQERKTE